MISLTSEPHDASLCKEGIMAALADEVKAERSTLAHHHLRIMRELQERQKKDSSPQVFIGYYDHEDDCWICLREPPMAVDIELFAGRAKDRQIFIVTIYDLYGVGKSSQVVHCTLADLWARRKFIVLPDLYKNILTYPVNRPIAE